MSSSYRLVTFDTDAVTLEQITAELYDGGCLGLEEVEKFEKTIGVKAYFPETKSENILRTWVVTLLGETSRVAVSTIGLPPFRSFTYDAFMLIPGIQIEPPSDLGGPSRPSESAIQIRPARAFGSGRHETTRLAAKMLQPYCLPGASLLDLGTGSGILAILARKLGCGDIAAVEIDGEALENAKENFSRNSCANIRLVTNIDQIHETFDRITANVLTPTLLYLREALVERLKPGGILILSGITHEEEPALLEAYSSLRAIGREIEGEWCCLAFEKGSP